MMAVQFEDKKVLAKMKRMETTVVQKAVRKGVRAGRKDTLAKARDNAARLEGEGTGMAEKIASSLKLMVTGKRKLHASDAYAIEVGFDTKKVPELIDKKNFIPFAIEYGHAGPGQGGTKTKVAAPKPFMRPAHEATKAKSIDVAKRVIARELKKEWNK